MAKKLPFKLTWCLGNAQSESLQELYDKTLHNEDNKVLTNNLNEGRVDLVHSCINRIDISYQQKINILDTYRESLVD